MNVGRYSGVACPGALCCGNNQSGRLLAVFARASGPPRSVRQYAIEKISTFVAHAAMLEARSWRPLSSVERRTIADNTWMS